MLVEILYSIHVRLTLGEILKLTQRRILLLTKGDRTGVAIWWLAGRMDLHSDLRNIKFQGYESQKNNLYESLTKAQDVVKKRKNYIAPENWNAGTNLATFLFDYVVNNKPKVILETGVANGITTRIIQAADVLNETQFHSIDINPNCAAVNSDSKNWTFHHLKGSNLKIALQKIVKTVPQVDLWIHDSDHSYLWQTFEYKLALEKLNPGGLLVSDDVDFTKSWGELSKSKEIQFICTVLDGNKCFGIAQKK